MIRPLCIQTQSQGLFTAESMMAIGRIGHRWDANRCKSCWLQASCVWFVAGGGADSWAVVMLGGYDCIYPVDVWATSYICIGAINHM